MYKLKTFSTMQDKTWYMTKEKIVKYQKTKLMLNFCAPISLNLTGEICIQVNEI